MVSEHLSKFKEVFNQTNDIAKALKAALSLYLKGNELKKYDTAYLLWIYAQEPDQKTYPKTLVTDTFTDTFKAFSDHLDNAEVGSLVLGYRFELFEFFNLKELKELFTLAELFETSALRAPSNFILDCKNIMAAENYSPKIVYSQTARVEKALISDEVEKRYVDVAKAFLQKYLYLLYTKLAMLILLANDLHNFKILFSDSFPEEECLGLPKLNAVRHGMLDRVKYFEEGNFLEDYYAASSLSYKYNCAAKYYALWKNENSSLILKFLCNQIVDKVYQDYEAHMFELMRQGDVTVAVVFNKLDAWANSNWRSYKNTNLHYDLSCRIKKIKEDYFNWQKYDQLERKAILPKPMYELYCLKRSYQSKIDPKAILESYKEKKTQLSQPK